MHQVYYDDNGDVQMDVPPKYRLRSKNLKVKSTFYNHSCGFDFDPILHVVYPKNRADQLSYQPTAKLVDQMFKTGQMIQASKQYYDFPNGKDDGRDVPFDRLRGLEMPDVAQAMLDNESKLRKHADNVKAMAMDARQKKAAEKASEDKKEDGASVASD